MLRTALTVGLAAALLAACSDDTTGVLSDGPVAGDTGVTADNGGTADTGTTVDTVVPVDQGPVADTGGTTDGPAVSCDPGFSAKQACGGALSGTKWKYVTGCVNKAAFDELKKNCPGTTVSNVSYSMAPNNTLQFYANGSLLRVFSGEISSKMLFPGACTKLGCKALQGVLALIVAKYPGSKVVCTAASGGGCTCDAKLKLFALGGGKYAVSGNKVTVTAAGKSYPYNYCVKGNVLTYAGTPQNTSDKNVTYVLTRTP